MKFSEFKLAEWDKTFKTVAQMADVEILQLNLVKLTLKIEGRRNLVAVDKSGNVKWVAELPDGENNGYSYFNNFAYKGKKLKGWYGGSQYIEIDIETGKLVKEGIAS